MLDASNTTANATPSTTDWARQRELFEAALDLPDEARIGFIQAHTKDEPELAQSLNELLAAHAKYAGNTGEQSHGLLDQIGQLTEQAALGTQVGPYTLQSEIGRGGMGVVWLARRNDGTLAQTVAIKLLPPHRWDAQSRARFNAERQIIASLEHPGIARLLDAGEIQGQPYFVMEYVEGKSITDYAAAKTLTQRERIALFQQVLDAVDYAHRQLVIHRDLKPSNILVTESGMVKLIDFGIAKTLSIDASDTGTNQRFFSPSHAAPEQLTGKSIGVGVDIYQLGTVLYELLSGMPAFDFTDSSAAQIEAAIRSQPPKAPSKHKASISAELDAIALHCLKKAANERYLSIHALTEDLRRVLTHRVISIRQGQGVYRVRKFLRRNLLGVAASVVFFALIAGFAWTSYQQALAVRIERDRAVQSQKDAEATSMLLTQLFSSNSAYVNWDADSKFLDIVVAVAKKLNEERSLPFNPKFEVVMSLARTLTQLSKIKDAEDMLRNIKAACDRSCSKRQLGLWFNEMSLIEITLGNYEKSSNLSVLADKFLVEGTASLEDIIEARAQHMANMFVTDRHNADQKHFPIITQIWEENKGLLPLSSDANQLLDSSYLRLFPFEPGNIEDKILQLERLLRQYQLAGVNEKAINLQASQALGDLHLKIGNFEKAKISFLVSLKLATKLWGAKSEHVARALQSLGVCSLKLNDAENAKSYFETAERALFIRPGPTPGQISISSNLGLLYLNQIGDYSKAIFYFTRARDFSTQIWGKEDSKAVHFALLNSLAHIRAGKSTQAVVELTALLDESPGEPTSLDLLYLTRLYLSFALYKTGNSGAASLQYEAMTLMKKPDLLENDEETLRDLLILRSK